jgi:hypothetical protein
VTRFIFKKSQNSGNLILRNKISTTFLANDEIMESLDTLLVILANKKECEIFDYLDAVKSGTVFAISIHAGYFTCHYFVMVAIKTNVYTLSG